MKQQIDKKNYFVMAIVLAGIVLSVNPLLARPGTGHFLPAVIQEESRLEKGVLNFIFENNTVVINDQVFTVGKQTRFYSVNGSSVSLGSFHEDQDVEFFASEEQVLVEMHKAKGSGTAAPGNSSTDEMTSPASGNGGMRLENGVWVN